MISFIYTILAAILLVSCCPLDGLPTAERTITADLLIKLNNNNNNNKSISLPTIEHEMLSQSIVEEIF